MFRSYRYSRHNFVSFLLWAFIRYTSYNWSWKLIHFFSYILMVLNNKVMAYPWQILRSILVVNHTKFISTRLYFFFSKKDTTFVLVEIRCLISFLYFILTNIKICIFGNTNVTISLLKVYSIVNGLNHLV